MSTDLARNEMALVANGDAQPLSKFDSQQKQEACAVVSQADTLALAPGEGCSKAQGVCDDVSLVGRRSTHGEPLGFLASLFGPDLPLLEPSLPVINLGSPISAPLSDLGVNEVEQVAPAPAVGTPTVPGAETPTDPAPGTPTAMGADTPTATDPGTPTAAGAETLTAPAPGTHSGWH